MKMVKMQLLRKKPGFHPSPASRPALLAMVGL